jgi:type IV secretion system protein VirB11
MNQESLRNKSTIGEVKKGGTFRMAVALRKYLEPIKTILADPDVNEITINRPHEYIIEKPSGKAFIETDDFSMADLEEMATLIASHTHQKINKQHPILSGSLPDGERVQIIMSPAVRQGQFAMSIRKPTDFNLTLNDYTQAGAFNHVKVNDKAGMSDSDIQLLRLKNSGDIEGFMTLAVTARKNIVVSGGTSSGKTTFLNALIKCIPLHERLITIEDVQETVLHHKDKLNLLCSKGEQGLADVTPKDLLEACLRLNPDRILLSELRGEEAFYFLRAVNSGHPGSITTLHANTVQGAFEQIVMMVNQTGLHFSEDTIRTYLKTVVDVVVQFAYDKSMGKRVMTELYFDPRGAEPEDASDELIQTSENLVNFALPGGR